MQNIYEKTTGSFSDQAKKYCFYFLQADDNSFKAFEVLTGWGKALSHVLKFQ